MGRDLLTGRRPVVRLMRWLCYFLPVREFRGVVGRLSATERQARTIQIQRPVAESTAAAAEVKGQVVAL